MNPPQYILQPVRPWFIVVSLVVSLFLNMLPWGRLPGVPDFLALTLLYWNVRAPRRVGIGWAFLLGILMDVNDAGLVGEHALAFTLMSYTAIILHRRILAYPLWSQAVYILPLLLGVELLPFIARWVVTGDLPAWGYLSNGLVGALIWPIVSILLIAPQKRAVDPDDTRPI
jgi:rod shape-determining protein MreD